MPLLALHGVSKAFGGLLAVDAVSFAVEAGQIVGLIGPNGAGKTTLFNLINGFIAPSRGEIRFEGEPIQGQAPHQICRRGIARTFQVVKPLRRMTVLDNVIAGAFLRCSTLPEATRRAEETLEFCGLAAVTRQLAQGLPLGLRKRLEIARALATRPKLLLLDEACAGLNPAELDASIAIIRRIHASGVTLLVIEHHMKVIMSISQQIVVLNYGREIASGEPAAVAADPAVIAAYLGEEALRA